MCSRHDRQLEAMPNRPNWRRNGEVAAFCIVQGSIEMADMKLLDRITVESGKCGARPCIRGLRIRVTDILAMLADGVSDDEVRDAACLLGLSHQRVHQLAGRGERAALRRDGRGASRARRVD